MHLVDILQRTFLKHVHDGRKAAGVTRVWLIFCCRERAKIARKLRDDYSFKFPSTARAGSAASSGQNGLLRDEKNQKMLRNGGQQMFLEDATSSNSADQQRGDIASRKRPAETEPTGKFIKNLHRVDRGARV